MRFLVTMSVLGVINIVCFALFWTVSQSYVSMTHLHTIYDKKYGSKLKE